MVQEDPLGRSEVPWIEKYRPATLDDVAANKEIIDTSRVRRTVERAWTSSPKISPEVCFK